MNKKLTKRLVEASGAGEKECRIMDTMVEGFGVKITTAGRKIYFLRYRFQGERVFHTIGKHDQPWTVEKARTEAQRLLGLVAANKSPKLEKSKMSDGLTVAELCDSYVKAMEAGTVFTRLGTQKKASTLATDRGRIKRHIKPLLGKRKVKAITKRDVEEFRDAVTQGKTATVEKTGLRGRAVVTGGSGTASRTLGLLSGIFAYAVDKGVRDVNPVHGVRRAPDKKRNRSISKDEYAKIGKWISDSRKAGVNAAGLDALLVLLLTGCRKSEIAKLKWSELDTEHSCLRLEDTKTGRQIRPLGQAAVDVLAKQHQHGDNPYVFPAVRGEGCFQGLPKLWNVAREDLSLSDVTIHTFRHAFASVAAELGYSELTIAGMLGHSSGSVTARYVHVVDRALVEAADRVVSEIVVRLAYDNLNM